MEMLSALLFELDAIAAVYVGGMSATGGVGRVTGSLTSRLAQAQSNFCLNQKPHKEPFSFKYRLNTCLRWIHGAKCQGSRLSVRFGTITLTKAPFAI